MMGAAVAQGLALGQVLVVLLLGAASRRSTSADPS
jgi:hypothetical protein